MVETPQISRGEQESGAAASPDDSLEIKEQTKPQESRVESYGEIVYRLHGARQRARSLLERYTQSEMVEEELLSNIKAEAERYGLALTQGRDSEDFPALLAAAEAGLAGINQTLADLEDKLRQIEQKEEEEKLIAISAKEKEEQLRTSLEQEIKAIELVFTDLRAAQEIVDSEIYRQDFGGKNRTKELASFGRRLNGLAQDIDKEQKHPKKQRAETLLEKSRDLREEASALVTKIKEQLGGLNKVAESPTPTVKEAIPAEPEASAVADADAVDKETARSSFWQRVGSGLGRFFSGRPRQIIPLSPEATGQTLEQERLEFTQKYKEARAIVADLRTEYSQDEIIWRGQPELVANYYALFDLELKLAQIADNSGSLAELEQVLAEAEGKRLPSDDSGIPLARATVFDDARLNESLLDPMTPMTREPLTNKQLASAAGNLRKESEEKKAA